MLKHLFTIVIASYLAACTSISTGEVSTTPIEISNPQQAEKYWKKSTVIEPKYPQTARSKGVAGCARFKVTILESGATSNVNFIESFPKGEFISESKKALQKWHWEPTPSNTGRQPITRIVQFDYYDKAANNLARANAFCTV